MAVTNTDHPTFVQYVDDAAKTFLASLSPDESVLFQATKAAGSLLQEIEAVNNEHKNESASRKASVVLLPFLAGIEQYGMAMDVFANSNDLLCPIWGSIRIVLHVRAECGGNRANNFSLTSVF